MPTAQQIADIQAAYAQTVATGDASLYYAALSNAGITYGTFALGVVGDNTLVGVVANNYADNKIDGDFASNLFDGRREVLMLELAVRDYEARSVSADWELTGKQISDYHDAAYQTVFSELPGAAEGWVPYYEVRALDDYEFWMGGTASAFLSYAKMNVPLTFGTPEQVNYAFQWFQDMDPFVFNATQLKFVPGDNVLAKSLIEWGARTTGFLDATKSYLLNDQPYAPADEEDHAGFLGRYIHGLLMEETLQGSSSMLALSSDHKQISFGASSLPTNWIEFKQVVGQTMGTVNGPGLAGYAEDWTTSSLYKVTAPSYFGLDPHGISNLTGATLVMDQGVTIDSKDGNFIVMQGDVDDIVISNTYQFMLVGNDRDNTITTSSSDLGYIASGAGNDHIIVSGVADTRYVYLTLPMMIDSGSGNDTIEFQDNTPKLGYWAGYVMSSDGGHDKLINNTYKYNDSDPNSSYSGTMSSIYLKDIAIGDIILEKTLVATRQEITHVSYQWYETDYIEDWYDVSYKYKSSDGATSIDLGIFSWVHTHENWVSTDTDDTDDVTYIDFTVDWHMRNGFVQDVTLVDKDNGFKEFNYIDASAIPTFFYSDGSENIQTAYANEMFDLGVDDGWIIS